MFFENMGITYLGPVDGTNIKEIRKVLAEAKRVRGPVLVHVRTVKGEGYLPAERHPARFHGTGPFDIDTGVPLYHQEKAHYTDVFSTVMRKMGEREPKVVAITAAMADGTGLKRFKNLFPERFFDVGIAEEHAVTFAAGLAAGGMRPIVAIYSSFLQRAYDQIVHDVCMQKLHVVFAIDRAGIVGADGETHQGVFDISFLSHIPNMTVLSPKNAWELEEMLDFAVNEWNGPIAVRYPRGTAYAGLAEYRAPIELGKAEWIVREGGIALFAVGSMVKTAEEVQALLHEKGYRASIINARFIKPIDEEAVLSACEDHDMIVTMEENVLSGGFGEKVLTCLNDHDRQIKCVMAGIPDAYVEHGNVDLLKKEIAVRCRPRCLYAFFEASPATKNHIGIGGVELHTGAVITPYLLDADRYVLFIATAGQEFEQFQHEVKSSGDILQEFLLDSLGSAIAEAVVREVCSKVENYVLPLGYGVSHPYSPGYCGWHVTQQKFLFSLLPEQPCGVRLSESSLMSPIKSVSGVIAVGERIVKRKYGCELCGKADCYKNRNKLKK